MVRSRFSLASLRAYLQVPDHVTAKVIADELYSFYERLESDPRAYERYGSAIWVDVSGAYQLRKVLTVDDRFGVSTQAYWLEDESVKQEYKWWSWPQKMALRREE